MLIKKIKNKIAMKCKPISKIEDKKLNQYLLNFNCVHCHNHCRLSSIKCGRGLESRDKKIVEYNKNNIQ